MDLFIFTMYLSSKNFQTSINGYYLQVGFSWLPQVWGLVLPKCDLVSALFIFLLTLQVIIFLKLLQKHQMLWEELAQNLGCKISAIPLNIQGYYQKLISYVRLFGMKFWKGLKNACKLKNQSGRLTLIKSMLSSFPTYFMSLFPLPCLVANRKGKNSKELPLGWFGE